MLLVSLMLFSIIIPTYKRHEDLCKCLQCLAHYFEPGAQERLGFAVEVIVSDDAREPELKTLLAEKFPWCRHVDGPGRGPAANRNHGAKHAQGEWLVFTDDDCLPQPGWLEAYFAHRIKADVLEGKTSAFGTRKRIDEDCPINEGGGLLWSCNFGIQRERFWNLGGFNEDFPAAAMEDVEFRTRLEKLGIQYKFIPNALIYHPWRRLKSTKFWRHQGNNVAHYVHMHPEKLRHFILRNQIISLVRALIKEALPGLIRYKGRGFFNYLWIKYITLISIHKALYRLPTTCP